MSDPVAITIDTATAPDPPAIIWTSDDGTIVVTAQPDVLRPSDSPPTP